MMSKKIPPNYLLLADGSTEEAAILFAEDWKRAATDRMVERDKARAEIEKLTLKLFLIRKSLFTT